MSCEVYAQNSPAMYFLAIVFQCVFFVHPLVYRLTSEIISTTVSTFAPHVFAVMHVAPHVFFFLHVFVLSAMFIFLCVWQLMQVMAWVLGEYGALASIEGGLRAVSQRLCDVAEGVSFRDPSTCGFVVTALMKLSAQSGLVHISRPRDTCPTHVTHMLFP